MGIVDLISHSRLFNYNVEKQFDEKPSENNLFIFIPRLHPKYSVWCLIPHSSSVHFLTQIYKFHLCQVDILFLIILLIVH